MISTHAPRPIATLVVLAAFASVAVAQAYPLISLDGAAPNVHVGVSVGGGGDVDLDGRPDVLIGAKDAVTVLSGATGTVYTVLHSGNGNPGFGASVADAGDQNGDGQADILVGARTGGLAGTGAAFLLSGATGAVIHAHSYPFSPAAGGSVAGLGDVDFDLVPDYAIGGSSTSGVAVYSGAGGTPLFTLAQFIPPFGSAEQRWVAPVGDVDQDGAADILVGLPANVALVPTQGLARVYSGTTGAILRTVIGPTPEFGSAVAGVGDVTGDGVPDFIVGAPRTHATQPAAPGFAQVVSGANGAVVLTITGTANGDQFGASVGGLGDVDGDGVRDAIVGAPGNGSGYVRIVSCASGETLLTAPGNAVGERFGAAVCGLGDIGFDGVPDFVVGAPDAAQGGGFSGAARVLSYAGVPPSCASFGTGCAGQGGNIPLATTGGGAPSSTGNTAFRILLTNAKPGALVALEAGFSDSAWGAIPLPWNLGSLGMPACHQLVSVDHFFPLTATSDGRAVFPLGIPPDPALSGATGFVQWFVVDPGPAILPGVMSNALRITVL